MKQMLLVMIMSLIGISAPAFAQPCSNSAQIARLANKLKQSAEKFHGVIVERNRLSNLANLADTLSRSAADLQTTARSRVECYELTERASEVSRAFRELSLGLLQNLGNGRHNRVLKSWFNVEDDYYPFWFEVMAIQELQPRRG